MAARRRKKNLYRSGLPVILIFLFLSLLIIVILSRIGWWRAETKKYPAFGIEVPLGYAIHGIDVSRYQKHISWKMVSEMVVEDVQIGFVFIKATEGANDMDARFKSNWRQSAKHDITRGAYHFFIPTKSTAGQAMNFISRVSLEPGDLPPVLDIEQAGNIAPPVLRKKAKAWLEIIEKHYQMKPIIYTNINFYNQYLGKEFDDYPLWIAHYYEKSKPRVKRGWTFWQHNDRGNVNGIDARVDFNVFNGDSAAFRHMLKK